MIQVKAMEDRAEEQGLLDAAGVEGRVLLMKDGGEPVGYVVVALEETVLHLRKIFAKGYDFTERPQGEALFVLDTLMRSAASYGEDHGADQIVTDFPDFFDFFKRRGFDVAQGHAFTPISTIVRYEQGGQGI